MVVPLSGPLAALGLGMRNAGELAVEQANQTCAVPGYRLALQAENDRATPAGAAEPPPSWRVDPAVVGVVGTLNSSTAQAVQPIFAERGIVLVSSANTSRALTQGADGTGTRPYDTYFRVSATDAALGPFAAQYLVDTAGVRTIAVIDDGGAYGSGIADDFARAAQQLGATIVARQRVEQDTDFSGVIAAIRDLAPEAVYYGGEYPAAGQLSAQLAAAGLDVPLVGGDALISAEYVGQGGRPGDLATAIGAPVEQLVGARQFAADYAAAGYGEDAETFGAPTYDATDVVIRAVASALAGGAWSAANRPAVVAAVQATAFDGVTGPVSFDEFGDVSAAPLTVYRVEGGAFVPIESGVYDPP